MALEKEFNYKGIICNYWKIIGVKLSYIGGKNSSIQLGLYLNKEARDASVDNFINITNFTLADGDYTREDLYNYIKQQPEAEGAKDI